LIHGRPRSCDNIIELDYARQRNDLRYFAGWTDQDYEAAVAWASVCSQYGYPGWGPSRFQFLRALRERARQLAQQHADAEQAAAQQAAAAQALREKDAEAQRAQQAEEEQAEKRPVSFASQVRRPLNCIHGRTHVVIAACLSIQSLPPDLVAEIPRAANL
jgi:hypothetical protein